MHSYFGISTYLFSNDERSWHVFLTLNYCCKFLALDGDILQNDHQTCFKVPFCSASLRWSICSQSVGWLIGCRSKTNSPLMEPGPTGWMSSLGVFLILILARDPSPYILELRRELPKTLKARSTSATEIWTWYLPSTSSQSDFRNHFL